ncbi:MAG: rod shape-determining protein MreD [Pseudomonadota bacterium]
MGYRAEYLLRLLKAAAPTFFAFFGVLLMAAPLRLFEGVAPTPIIPLFFVFYWSIYAPNYLPAPSVFAVGLLQDFLTGGPLGLWAAVYLAAQFVVMSQRSYFAGRDRSVVWMGFLMAALGVALLFWLTMSLMAGRLLPLGGLAYQLAATVILYPVFDLFFGRLHRRVLVEA